MYIEREISEFFIKLAKFEYFLITRDPTFAKKNKQNKITGVEWDKLAEHINKNHELKQDQFGILQAAPPNFLVFNNGRIEWGENNNKMNTWGNLIKNSFAQLRNNIAHGSKAHPSNNTKERTRELISQANELMNFIAEHVFNSPRWNEEIIFKY